MAEMTFSKVTKEYFPLLKQYTPLIARIHGRDHPELVKVRKIFKEMNKKFRKNRKNINQVDFSAEFKQLRTITDNYTVPSDGCGMYLETYAMLERADNVYHS